ncbi:hypothetical protein BP6252_13964 [Coleophoma cylindrospora]|uniref:Major facilitator superfamily (MFS) profile domain-containing protein n=1 Tax=Coleophoma cylindrospora TaxID=1849047 RepID=A0A3D8Q532_9HELO|nr:hypothetical protein BP6252_13964 [Coleophoma cylindrospora]
MALPPRVYQFLVGVFAALGSFLYGYDLTIVAEVVSSKSFLDKFNPTTTQVGLVASLLTGGAFVGAGMAGFSSDLLGRRATILGGGVFFCLGGGLQTGASNYGFIIGGRFVAGIGIGILTMIIPLYQAELAHPDVRGLITGLQQFMLGIGGVCGSWISYGTFVSYTDSRQWRIPFGIQIVPAALLSILIFLFPESPRWLIKKGRGDEGLRTLAQLHSNGDITNPWVLAEQQQIVDQVNYEQEAEAKSLTELFKTKANFRRIMIACAIQAATQLTGVSAIQYYSVTIFKQIGINGTDTLRYQAINSVIGLLGEFLIMLFVDKVGRRTIIIWGNLAMCLTYIISTILLEQYPPSNNNTGAHWAFVVMTWVFNFTFASMGSLSWIIPAEIFDTVTRSKGVAIAAMISFAFNTMIGQVTPIGMANSHWRFYLLFVITNFSNAVFFWAMLPETKKLALEEMNMLFSEAPFFIGNRSEKIRQECAIGGAAMLQDLKTGVHTEEAEHVEQP